MAKTRKGGYMKDGDVTEIRIAGSATYTEVVATAATALDLLPVEIDFEGDPELTLFRSDGTVVPNKPIVSNYSDRSEAWTLERYLKSSKKSAAQLKLGVGYRYKVYRNLKPYTGKLGQKIFLFICKL